jgi:nucleoside-diphosphate-sugar epimerase
MVADFFAGTILAAKKIDDGMPINLGTMEGVRVLEPVHMVFELTGRKANIKLRPDMPTGSLNRVADNSLAKKLLAWEPKIIFRQGSKTTTDWYYKNKDREHVKATLEHILIEG